MERLKQIFLIITGNLQLCFAKLCHSGLQYHPIILKRWTARVEVKKKAVLKLGKKIRLRENSLVRSSGELIMGENCEIGPNAEIMASGGCVKIGDNVFFNRNCIVVGCGNIEIGSGTAIGCGVTILDHDHKIDHQGSPEWNKVSAGNVKIGKNVWIGANTLILCGSEIGDNSVIAAGSVVKSRVPASMLFLQKRSVELRSIE